MGQNTRQTGVKKVSVKKSIAAGQLISFSSCFMTPFLSSLIQGMKNRVTKVKRALMIIKGLNPTK